MDRLEIEDTIDEAVHDALLDGLHLLDQDDLLYRADDLLRRMPSVNGTPPTGSLLLRRYRGSLQKELCLGREPRPMSEVVEDEVREITRAVMVSAGLSEGFSVDTAVLLALAIRAGGVEAFCATPAFTATG